MAGVKIYIAMTTELTLLTTSGFKTLLMYEAASNVRALIESWGVYPRGKVNSDEPVRFRLVKCSDNGTGGTAITTSAVTINDVAETKTGTFTQGTFSVEPTVSEVWDQKSVHPQAGIEWPSITPGMRQVGGGDIIAILYENDGGGAAIPCTAELLLEQ